MSIHAGTLQARRSIADLLWLGLGAVVVGAVILMALTVLGPLGTFGQGAERIGPGATLIAPSGPIEIGGQACHQCRPGI